MAARQALGWPIKSEVSEETNKLGQPVITPEAFHDFARDFINMKDDPAWRFWYDYGLTPQQAVAEFQAAVDD